MNKAVGNKIASAKKIASLIIFYLLLTIFALAIIIPFYMIVITSLKRTNALATKSPFVWFPSLSDISFNSYGRVFTDYQSANKISLVLTGLMNTMIIMVPTLLIGMFSSAIAAFAYAKMKFPFKSLLFSVLLASMMLPGIVLLVPSFVLYDTLNLTNTFFPLMAPGMFGSVAAIFFLRQFYRGLPDELVEAAKIDGMNHFKIFFVIIVPLSMPALLAQGVLGFLGIYNDYLGPLIYLNRDTMYTLQLALKEFSGSTQEIMPVMAGAVMAMLPALALYFIAQKYFIQGIAMSGLKA